MADTNLLILAREFKTLRNRVQEVLKMPVGPQGLQGDKGEQGVKGETGAPGKNGKDGKDGVNGLNGTNGINGTDGVDGADGLDGVGVQNAYIDFDNSLVIVLTSGQEINAGFLSQETKESVVATFKQGAQTINELLPVQTSNAGKYLTTDGENVSWATISGGGAVSSVNGQTGVVVLNAADIGAEPADATILKDADIGTTVQAYDVDLTAWAGVATSAKQDTLVSGTNIKTINGSSLLGSGDLTISGGGGASALTISNKTAAYTVVAGDLGKIINCTSGTFTVSLTAAATLGAGFNCWIWNTSATETHAITIDPSGAETIDGVSTRILRRGEGTQIICDGTNWQTGDKKTMRSYAENLAANHPRPVASGTASLALGGYGFASSTASNSGTVAINGDASAFTSTAIGLNSGGGLATAASGSGAMALGGSYASGTDSFAAAVANNTSSYGATGANAVALGQTAKATGSNSVAIGQLCTASANFSYALGYSSTASGTDSIAFGNRADTGGITGKYTFGGGATVFMSGMQVLRAVTTNATATVFCSNSSAAGTTNQVILPNNSAYAFSGIVVARQQAAGGTASAAWKVEGLIRREGSAGTTTLVASTVTAISNVPGWTLALSADTTNGGLAVTFTGAAATNIRTVATIQTSEVTYA